MHCLCPEDYQITNNQWPSFCLQINPSLIYMQSMKRVLLKLDIGMLVWALFSELGVIYVPTYHCQNPKLIFVNHARNMHISLVQLEEYLMIIKRFGYLNLIMNMWMWLRNREITTTSKVLLAKSSTEICLKNIGQEVWKVLSYIFVTEWSLKERYPSDPGIEPPGLRNCVGQICISMRSFLIKHSTNIAMKAFLRQCR